MLIADSPNARAPSRPLSDPAPNPSDQDLIAAVNRGDLDAFELLYRRHRDWVVRVALRYTHNEDLALDTLQELFLYFLKKFPGFQLTCQLQTFLYPAIRNLALGLRKKSERYLPDSETLDQIPAPIAPETHATDDLLAIIRALPEPQREVLLLRFVDGLPLAEIAIALEIPLGTVKSRLHNALSTLEKDPQTKKYFTE